MPGTFAVPVDGCSNTLAKPSQDLTRQEDNLAVASMTLQSSQPLHAGGSFPIERLPDHSRLPHSAGSIEAHHQNSFRPRQTPAGATGQRQVSGSRPPNRAAAD